MERIKVSLDKRSYYIYTGYDIISRLKKVIDTAGLVVRDRACAVITDTTVKALWLGPLQDALQIDLPVYAIPPGEVSKSIDTAMAIYTQLLETGIDRHNWIIALGGGVVGDLAGFIAATYMRGIPYIQVPTTLMAQLDSSIGGKTAVDLPEGKNLVGSFWQPRFVFTDIRMLTTLPEKEIKAGLAEAIKYGIIKDAELFKYLEKNIERLSNVTADNMELWDFIISRCIKIKADITAKDERDIKGVRAVLNYGHTVGHALEAVMDYKKLTHGQAVAAGIAAAAMLSHKLGYLSLRDMNRQINLIEKVFPALQNCPVQAEDIKQRLRYDKKAQDGKLRFILARGIGRVFISDNVSEDDTSSVLEEICQM